MLRRKRTEEISFIVQSRGTAWVPACGRAYGSGIRRPAAALFADELAPVIISEYVSGNAAVEIAR
jgi:hypothetical protein